MQYLSPLQVPGMPAQVMAQLLISNALSDQAKDRLQQVLISAGIDINEYVAHNEQVPMQCFRDAFPDMDAELASLLGFSAGEQARLTSFSVLSVPLVSAGSVREVMNLLAFTPLISSVFTARFVEQEDAVVVMLTVSSGDEVLDRIPIFYAAAALIRLLNMLSNKTLAFTFNIAWPLPAQLQDHAMLACGRIRFNAPMHYITVPRKTLDEVCQFADPIAYQNAVNALQARLLNLTKVDDVVIELTRFLDAANGLVKIEDAASHFNVSVSTFKRRLAAAGTHYREVHETVLRDKAVIMLMETSMTLEAVALALGYSDIANFSHAFKRWRGRSPGAFRRQSA